MIEFDDEKPEQPEKPKRYDDCERCGEPFANYVNDPYQADINNREVKRYLCRSCYNDIAGDI
jgi:formylmethanofuran dehydrogenase subunit E